MRPWELETLDNGNHIGMYLIRELKHDFFLDLKKGNVFSLLKLNKYLGTFIDLNHARMQQWVYLQVFIMKVPT